jgi:hypothetical protein
MNLPFNLNDDWGKEIAEMVGEFISLDTSNANLVTGKYLRARVWIDVNEPLQRWVVIDSTLREACDWYDVKYENVPYFCFSCGLLGHSDLVCPNPGERDELGRLPYWPSLRVEDRKGRAAPFAWGNFAGGGNNNMSSQAAKGASSSERGCDPPPVVNQGGGRGRGRAGSNGGRFAGARGNTWTYRKLTIDGLPEAVEPMEVENRLVQYAPPSSGGKREERPENTNSAAPSPDAKKTCVVEKSLAETGDLASAASQLAQPQ